MKRRIMERGVAATELAEQLLYAQGSLRRTETELRAGDRVLNNDTEFLGRIGKAASMGVSLYLGNRRIASTAVLDAGTAAEIGGYADALLVDCVLRKRDVYKGVLTQADRQLLVVARPLYVDRAQEDSGPIGIIEVFQDEHTLLEMMAVSARIGRDKRLSARKKHADGMENIIDFLDDVARRLQLLALNGNIIAAQAGEQGRAFRVVCRELGTLADRAKITVTDIRKLMHIMGLETSEETDLVDALAQPDSSAPAS
jgi:hypothetical protein